MQAVEKYVTTGIVIEGAIAAELAEKIDIDPAVWNKAGETQIDAQFGRTAGTNAAKYCDQK